MTGINLGSLRVSGNTVINDVVVSLRNGFQPAASTTSGSYLSFSRHLSATSSDTERRMQYEPLAVHTVFRAGRLDCPTGVLPMCSATVAEPAATLGWPCFSRVFATSAGQSALAKPAASATDMAQHSEKSHNAAFETSQGEQAKFRQRGFGKRGEIRAGLWPYMGKTRSISGG